MNIKEKIDTILLCDIATHLGIKSEIDPALVKYALTTGNEWLLNAEYSPLTEEDPSKEDRDFVVAILNMYRGLSLALRKLAPKDQEVIKEKHRLHIIDGGIQIPGFDGNNEYLYSNIVEAFLHVNRFAEQKSPVADTHSPTKHDYSSMLVKYNALDPWNRSNQLTVDELSSVLAVSPLSL